MDYDDYDKFFYTTSVLICWPIAYFSIAYLMGFDATTETTIKAIVIGFSLFTGVLIAPVFGLIAIFKFILELLK